ncbi:uncharacterized protein LOC111335634 [Stylophora pistillata]|uniref:uncharacterized protein LOC111335634 n=1 Tax=Stylophora pistillata TaxID=50429 RepID=UPI000C03CD42|nr:uncharacterized protein LOC111335634 [Stylophora pistillata]
MGSGTSKPLKRGHVKNKPIFHRISSPHSLIKSRYDVVVIGSGYGASIAASRCARADQSVCVLERGKEWLPGDFPETFKKASEHAQINFGGKGRKLGQPSDLYELIITDDLTVVQGCGLGGGSLVNANVGLDAEPGVFQDPVWPKELRDDVDQLLRIDRQHFVDMIKPTPYPDNYPPLHKLDRMKDGLSKFDIEDLDKVLYKTPLYVTFKDMPLNHVGIPQPKCTACGNCCAGCNVGAKNTLNFNYLPDAKAHGAEIFVEVEVVSILKSHNSTDWIVSYKRQVPGSFDLNEQFVRATYVILGAGALGSTKILQRSKERGLDVSDEIGKRFSTNGDAVGFSYNGDREANSLGVETRQMASVQPPGPTIVSAMDFRKVNNDNFEKNIIIEDGTPASSLSELYAFGVSFAAKVTGEDKFPSNEWLEKAFQELQGKGINNTLSLLCMSHDSASGVISFDNKIDDIDITWDRVGYESNFKTIDQTLQKIVHGLGGTYVRNPFWSETLGKSVVSVHPLGGCPMGDSGRTGVVNHAGQVFDGNTDELLEGLYVVDGSIIPRSVGVNPTLTISCLAERCMRLLVEKEEWKIDYDSFKPLGRFASDKGKPGIRFTEKMVGTFWLAQKNKTEGVHCEFTVTVQSSDVEHMLKYDPVHSAKMTGTLTCALLSNTPMTINEGHFQLLNQSTEHIDTKELLYKMILTGFRGKIFSFHGIKYVKSDSFGETGLKDTTVLFVTVYQGKAFSGKPVGYGKLFVTLPNFLRQLSNIEITNTTSRYERLKWTANLYAFFLGGLWEIYSPVTAKKRHFDLHAPPRLKRPLRLNGKLPEVFKCITKDKYELRLTRFQGGKKGPVVVFHGVGMNSGIFRLDTIETNFVEFLVAHRYDVWLVDWRTSCDLEWTVYEDYTLDDCAAYDFPAAIDKVLEITKQTTVQVVAHCGGSLVCFASLLTGALEGKIRSLISSQVAANPIPTQANKLKAGIYIPGTIEALGVDGITVDTDDFVSLSERLFNKFTEGVNKALLPYDELCDNPVCHRATFIYGLQWEHENLNPLTHDYLHELFGHLTTKVAKQLTLTMRQQKLVSATGEDIYLPDLEKKDRARSKTYNQHMQRLNIPVCFIVGEKNSCYLPESTHRTFNLVKEAHPAQEYTWIQIPGYGHLDCIIGKAAVHDVYPCILKALDTHAQDNTPLDEIAFDGVKKAVSSLKSKVCQTDGPKADPMTIPTLPAEMEESYLNDDASDDEELPYPAAASDVMNPVEVKSIWDSMDQITPLQAWQMWPSKSTRKSRVKNEPSYHPPKGTDIEKVEVREMQNPSDPAKNIIVSMSDLHLDSYWSKNMHERLSTFLKKLGSVAEVSIHTLILLGDVLEMWLDPITLTPPTLQEKIANWKKNETCSLFFSIVRKMAEEDGVKVFYVRGNHDHEITAGAVEELMGNKVEFIEGTLIYVINSDDGQQYRIRFAHGHDWDLFNTYALTEPNDPLGGRPVGYYVSRAVATAKTVMTETEEVLRDVTKALMQMVDGRLGSAVVQMLAKGPLQKRFTETMIERGVGRDVNKNECILLQEGKWIKMENFLKYRYFKRAIDKFGSSYTFSLLKGAVGNYDDFLSQCGEDVVVFGHTHIWRGHSIKSRIGKSIYVNTGSWIDHAHEFSYARITPPRKSVPGCVQVRRDLLDPDGIV